MKTDEIVSVNWEVLSASIEEALSNENFQEAEELALAALEEAEEFERTDRRLSITLESLSEIYYMQGKYHQGAPVCKRLLKLYSETLGAEHLDTAIIAHNLAMLYHSWGKNAQAEPYYKMALKVKTAALGQRHPEVLTLLGHYTTMLYQMNRAAEAEQLRASAVALSKGRFTRSGRWEAFVPATPPPAAE
ncbi:MAG TPA: tetratricopeptide repeat protein [Trichormus sp.]